MQLVLEHNVVLSRLTLSAGLTAVDNSQADMGMRIYPGVDASWQLADGWKLREGKLRNEDDEPRWYMDVKVAFNEYYPTKICMYSGKTRKELNEDTCAILDRARIINADMTVRPRYWEVNGKSGYKAYLKVLHVTIEEEDPWADAYSQYDEQ